MRNRLILFSIMMFALTSCGQSPEEQFQEGLKYGYGVGVPVNEGKAIELYKKASEAGNPKAQFYLGMMYRDGGVISIAKNTEYANKLFADAVSGLQKIAEQGDAEASFFLGSIYEGGFGVKEDNGKAEEWYKKAFTGFNKLSNADNIFAQYYIIMYYSDNVMDKFYTPTINVMQKDYSKAFNLLQKSAKKIPDSLYNLAVAYQHGLGISEDKTLGVELLHKAAEQGSFLAQMDLSMAYYDGYTIGGFGEFQKSDSRAFELYNNIINQGYTWPISNLSKMYFDGRGTPKDKDKGCELLRIGFQQKDEQLIEQYNKFCSQ